MLDKEQQEKELNEKLIKAIDKIGSYTLKEELYGTLERSPLGEYGGLQDLITYALNDNETELDMPIISKRVKKGMLRSMDDKMLAEEVARRMRKGE